MTERDIQVDEDIGQGPADTASLVQDIRRILSREGEPPEQDAPSLVDLLDPLHPADLAEILENLEQEHQQAVLLALPVRKAAQALEELEYEDQSQVLHLLTGDQAARILDEMSDDDIADLIGDLPPGERYEILELLEDDEASDVRDLLEYLKDSAGGIMTTDFVALSQEITAEEAIFTLRSMAPDAETVYYLYILDDQGGLGGVLSLRELIVAPTDTRLADLMNPNVISVQAATDQEEVAKIVSKYDLLAVPVVDSKGRLLGIVTVDDVLDVIEEEATEDYYRLSGTVPHEGEVLSLETPLAQKVRRRLPWLLGLLIGHLFTGRVISEFEATLQSVVALAYFIPVLMDMGGNVGTQSLAMVVRGLATGEMHAKQLVWAMFKEAQTGVVIGFILGVSIAIIALIWQGSPALGFVVGISMMVTVFAAAVLGTIIPLSLDAIGVDSAVASGPFITTLIDIASLIIYFSLATMMLIRV